MLSGSNIFSAIIYLSLIKPPDIARRNAPAFEEDDMRLWSIHPRYLDCKGLVALWREGLLAQSVLLDRTRGYRNHPQLARFRDTDDPPGAIARYLECVADEADSRRYNFDRSRINENRLAGYMHVTAGQVEFEFGHLLAKLKRRDSEAYRKAAADKAVEVHPLFIKMPGEIEFWERKER